MPPSTPASDQEAPLRLGTPAGRWLLAGTIVGSGMAMLDSTVVNVALARIGTRFGAGFIALQWVVNGYVLTLASLILLGGVLGDLYGRRRIYVLGTVWFTLASIGCALSPNVQWLIGARALQGVGAALLTPGSLALISASFAAADRSRAVGVWAGLGTVANAAGPLLGGWLTGINWRLVFGINVPLAAFVVWTALRRFPVATDRTEPTSNSTSDLTSNPTLNLTSKRVGGRRVDLPGTVCVALLLGGLTYALTAAGNVGWTPAVTGIAVAGLLAGVAFVLIERRTARPLMRLELFADRVFAATNLVTLFVYAALAVFFLLLVLQLQLTSGWTPLHAGLSVLPVTLLMLLLASRFGALTDRVGPRVLMSLGTVLAAAGFLLARRIGPDASYLSDVLPAVVLLGLGLSATVAPLTATVLAAAPAAQAGAASGINNAVARSAGLLAVAVIPAAAGLSGQQEGYQAGFSHGFGVAMVIGAALMLVGAATSWFGLGAGSRPVRAEVQANSGP